MTVINFTKEAAKRNKKLKVPPKQLPPLSHDDTQSYRGEFHHEEDKAVITVDLDTDKVTIDLYDQLTDQQYSQFTFDSYTLFLITESTRRMFKELDEVLN